MRGIAAVMQGTGLADKVVDLGNPDERTIADFARTVQIDDPTRRCPDIAKARCVQGWEPTVGPDEGLVRAIARCRALAEVSPRATRAAG